MSDIATKAGARFSASSKALLRAMRDDDNAFAAAAAEYHQKKADFYKALGFDDEAEVEQEAADAAEAEADEAEGEDEESPAVKALDYHTLAEMVEEAVCEAVCEVGLMGHQEDHGGMGPMAAQVAADLGEDEPEVYVYPKYAVACTERGDYQIPYTVEAGAIVIATPGEWKRVEKEWKVVAGAEAPKSGAPSDGPPASVMGGAVKFLEGDDDVVEAQAVLFGDPDHHDLSPYRDYFTKSTDFWLDKWDKRPIILHHAQPEHDMVESMRRQGAPSEAIKAMQEAISYIVANPVVGTWTKAWTDPVAVWLQGQIDKAHKYRSAVKEMIRQGLFKVSTDSAPHLIIRQPGPNGTNEVRRWPIAAASLTSTAAEPRLIDVAAKAILADYGLSIADTKAGETDDRERPDGAKAADEYDLELAAAELALFNLENDL